MSHRPSQRHHAASLSAGWLLLLPALALADALPPRFDAKRAAPPPHVAVPSPEADASGGSTVSPFAAGKAVAPNAQSLSAPVTVNANTSADALTATQTGTGRAISGVINNTKSTISALKGTTNGSGAALAGQNNGTTGSAGQLQITNASSSQPALVTSTTGTGIAIQAIQGNTGYSDQPAIYGQHTDGPSLYGIGVTGAGNYIGVKGQASGAGQGVYGVSSSGEGVAGESYSGYGVSGFSEIKPGVSGQSYSSYGVYGMSNSSYAGYFEGTVYVSGTLTAGNFAVASDRNVKEAFQPLDTESVLDRVAAMPISTWDFQAAPGIHHIGPMAQDFRAAFGLGADDKHIDLVDGVGVSLAAIQELQRQVKSKDARIGEQQGRIDALEARLTALEHGTATATGPSRP